MLRAGLAVSVALLVVSAVLAWQARINPQAHTRYALELQLAAELDAQLNEQVAESSMGMVTHYDGLVRSWDQLTDNQARLARPPRHLGALGRGTRCSRSWPA